MARDEHGRIENSKEQLETMGDDRLKEILKDERHGHNNKLWAKDILTDRRLTRLEDKLCTIADAITANPKVTLDGAK